jgi:hypothetical protein
MFTEAIARAVADARSDQLHHLSNEIWRAHDAGVLDDADASAALEAVQARRVALRHPPPPTRAIAPPASIRRPPRTPERQASIERRRRLVASGPLPPSLAARFTWGEIAVMRIVGDECRAHGCCSLHLDAIAARAGVHRTTVQNALREAQGRGEVPNTPIISVQERRRKGQRSLTNIIRIINSEWLNWLHKGPRRPAAGVGSNCTTDRKLSSTDTSKKERDTAAPDRREATSRRKEVT